MEEQIKKKKDIFAEIKNPLTMSLPSMTFNDKQQDIEYTECINSQINNCYINKYQFGIPIYNNTYTNEIYANIDNTFIQQNNQYHMISPFQQYNPNSNIFPWSVNCFQDTSKYNNLNINTKTLIKTLNDEYIYVNSKQFLRILRRREKRKNLNSKLTDFDITCPTNKPKYHHESRHKHAVTRERGKGGRFLSKQEKEELQNKQIKKEEKEE